MSGYSETQVCPKCKHASFEYDYDDRTGESSMCLACGHTRQTKVVEWTVTLKELNDIREDYKLKKLKKAATQF